MKEICGCCEGIQKLTPVARINRPGLNALSYRVGTHGSFLETMKARLSSLEFSSADFDEGVMPTAAQLRPLLGLKTRAPYDPAIALLDAWATVADVLTFYQERIANEGFLITATERRSVLELARLIGYRLRPGVAASVFLAYTLDKDKEVDIPAGARAQSLPGPGELPQSFETSDKLFARSVWNTLQVRLTRPQIPRARKALYFKGTTTKLKPNDPLLLDPGTGVPILLRVLTVEPDEANSRTKVSFDLWNQIPQMVKRVFEAQPSAPVAQPIAESITKVQEIVDRHKTAEGFEVNISTATARRVIGQLDELGSKLESSQTNEELKQVINTTLPALHAEHQLAIAGNFTKLQPWVASMISELGDASEQLTATETKVAEMSNVELSLDMQSYGAKSTSTEGTRSSLDKVFELIPDLGKPPSQQPPNSLQLGRSVAGSFSPASDTLPKLLVTMRPSLRNVFYDAWENLPVTVPNPARVYALRTRASVFGHNAPLKPITSKETGRVTGSEEWTLFRPTLGPTERVTMFIQLALIPQGNTALGFVQVVNVTIVINSIDSLGQLGPVLGRGTQPAIPLPGQVDLALSTPDQEVVHIQTSRTSPSDLKLEFQFSKRPLKLTVGRSETPATGGGTGRTATTWGGESQGSDPTVMLSGTSSFSDGPQAFIFTGDLHGWTGSTPTEDSHRVSLDASYNQILPGTWAVLDEPSGRGVVITQINGVREVARADYGMAGGSTQLKLDAEWISPGTAPGIPATSDGFEVIRGTTVFAQSELLELAEEPIDPRLEPVCGKKIELANLVNGLEVGRWLIFSGERMDIADKTDRDKLPPNYRPRPLIERESPPRELFIDTRDKNPRGVGTELQLAPDTGPTETLPGVKSSEVVMLAGVEQGYNPTLPGDITHTTLLLANDLAYCYKRDTLKIYGNVVKATHGETKSEVLGSGDGSQELQQFTLKQSPLTYLPAVTPAGAVDTLQVRVNDVLWHETENLIQAGPKDRSFVTSTDDEDQTSVEFGNGAYGARLATGVENVKAVYRVGIGQPGNVKAEQISSPVTKPLGVKSVINPLPATGGANREDRDQARRNAPLAVMALDRLVSVQDYEDFARTYAGIAKASAARLSEGRRQLVHLTIAGSDDIPIATTSDLFLNLRQALSKFGDPYHSMKLVVRKLKVLVISARVRLQPDYQWESVEPIIRAALLDKFSFARRELGQHALASEALSAIQARPEVAYVDLDTFDSISEDTSAEDLGKIGATLKLRTRIVVNKARVDAKVTDLSKRILPAELAYLSPSVAETLILTELTG